MMQKMRVLLPLAAALANSNDSMVQAVQLRGWSFNPKQQLLNYVSKKNGARKAKKDAAEERKRQAKLLKQLALNAGAAVRREATRRHDLYTAPPPRIQSAAKTLQKNMAKAVAARNERDAATTLQNARRCSMARAVVARKREAKAKKWMLAWASRAAATWTQAKWPEYRREKADAMRRHGAKEGTLDIRAHEEFVHGDEKNYTTDPRLGMYSWRGGYCTPNLPPSPSSGYRYQNNYELRSCRLSDGILEFLVSPDGVYGCAGNETRALVITNVYPRDREADEIIIVEGAALHKGTPKAVRWYMRHRCGEEAEAWREAMRKEVNSKYKDVTLDVTFEQLRAALECKDERGRAATKVSTDVHWSSGAPMAKYWPDGEVVMGDTEVVNEVGVENGELRVGDTIEEILGADGKAAYRIDRKQKDKHGKIVPVKAELANLQFEHPVMKVKVSRSYQAWLAARELMECADESQCPRNPPVFQFLQRNVNVRVNRPDGKDFHYRGSVRHLEKKYKIFLEERGVGWPHKSVEFWRESGEEPLSRKDLNELTGDEPTVIFGMPPRDTDHFSFCTLRKKWLRNSISDWHAGR